MLQIFILVLSLFSSPLSAEEPAKVTPLGAQQWKALIFATIESTSESIDTAKNLLKKNGYYSQYLNELANGPEPVRKRLAHSPGALAELNQDQMIMELLKEVDEACHLSRKKGPDAYREFAKRTEGELGQLAYLSRPQVNEAIQRWRALVRKKATAESSGRMDGH